MPSKEWYAKNPDRARAIQIAYRERHLEAERARDRARGKRNSPEQVFAMNAVRKLEREPCEVCGDPKVEGHHPDYSKPLEVNWLCHKHHMELHRKIA